MQIIKAKNTTQIIQLNSTYTSSFQGQGAPTITPQFVGQQYVDITTGGIYTAVGTNGSYNWGYVGSGMTSSFTKNTITGLIGWHDYSDLQTMSMTGNIISSIADKSNTGLAMNQESALTTTLVSNYQNGLSVAYCNGNSSMYSSTTTIGSVFTRIVVVRPTGWSTGGTQGIIGHNSIGYIGKVSGNTNLQMYNGAQAVITSLTNTYPYIIIGVFNGASSFCYVNGTKYTIVTPGTGALTRFNVGANALVGEFFTGYVMETLTYGSALADSQCLTINTYLNNKWGIY